MKICASCHFRFNSQIERIGKEGFGLNKPDFYCHSCQVNFCTYECMRDHTKDKHTAVDLV